MNMSKKSICLSVEKFTHLSRNPLLQDEFHYQCLSLQVMYILIDLVQPVEFMK